MSYDDNGTTSVNNISWELTVSGLAFQVFYLHYICSSQQPCKGGTILIFISAMQEAGAQRGEASQTSSHTSLGGHGVSCSSGCSLDLLLYSFPHFLVPALAKVPSSPLAEVYLTVHQTG